MKVKFTSLVALLLILVGATACSLNNNDESSKNIEQSELTGKIIENVDELNIPDRKEVTLSINGSNSYEDTIEIQEGDTAYDVLIKSSNLNKLGLVTKDYDFGKSIDGIGDDLAGTDNKYWLYYVNGEMVMQSVDNQKVNDGDLIEFKFEESTF